MASVTFSWGQVFSTGLKFGIKVFVIAFFKYIFCAVFGPIPGFALGKLPRSLESKREVSMSATEIRVIAGVLFVIVVIILVVRGKRMAAKRKSLP
ncbi:MAG: hypothetical protein DMG67_20050 [Acidobacteria bacterium]|nr:MAG: hypothetical protein DMG67_20050 [Acidobacteriota bacterium]